MARRGCAARRHAGAGALPRRAGFARGTKPTAAAAETRAAAAGVVKAIGAAGVIRVIVGLVDVPDQVAAGIHRLQVADFAIDGPGGVFILILVPCGAEGSVLPGSEHLSIGSDRELSELAVGFHVLVALRNQDVPIIIDLIQRGCAR